MKVQISTFFKTISFVLIVIFSFANSAKAQTTLAAGDIAITGYISTMTDEFSFVLLKNITSNTVINFTDNGWLSSNAFRTGETTITWTSNSALIAGQEIKIVGTTATLASGSGTAGTVTGTALSLSINGDQILAYQGTSASPTFITAIHMNVYDAVNNSPDPITTTAAAWEALPAATATANSSALPTGLTTGVNAIWIGTTLNISTEKDNARFVCAGDLSTVTTIKALIFNQTKWTTSDGDPAGFALPTSCSYITAVPAPSFTTNPSNSSICENANTSFTIVATGATTYQWQVDPGSGFVNLNNDAIYSNVTTTTINISNAPTSINGFNYRCVATNGTGPTNSSNALLTITALPLNPTLLVKTPTSNTVADGTSVSATFTAGSGGTGCTDDYRYTTDGGATYLTYTAGATIATTGLAATSGSVTIEGRRATCSGTCQNLYVPIASWLLTPLPSTATTLVAGDIAFSGYNSGTAADDFSFVLLRNIGPGTILNFTNNGWLSTSAFGTGEETITWTSPAGGLSAGTEIKIAGTTATKSSGGSAGTVTGTPFSLSINGDQILAYTGTSASPTFISAIHMNVYSTTNSDPVTTTAAAWDGTHVTVNASALPTGLTTGVNAIWIGTQGVIASEFDNAKYGNCANPAVLGPIGTLRASLNNQSNWTKNDGATGFTLPTACNYLNTLTPTITILDTPLVAFNACIGTASAEQSFKVSGALLTANILITAPTGFEVSTTSGSGFAGSITLTQTSGVVNTTTVYTRVTASATGTPAGNITVATTGVSTINIGVTGTVNPIPIVNAGVNQTICAGASATLTATCNLLSVTTSLSGTNEVPANASTASGTVKGTFDTTTKQLIITVSFSGLAANASAAHIHKGAAGANGPVQIAFTGFPAVTAGSYTYTGTLTAVQAADLLAGLYYVNVHNSSFPGGEIRGQLSTTCVANTFSWDNSGGLGQTVSVSPASTTTYTLTSSNSVTGCSSTSQTTIIVNPLPATPTITAGGPITFCGSGSVVLTSSSATGNLWSTSEMTPSITVTTAGAYTVTVNDGTCNSLVSTGTTVTINPIPTAVAAPVAEDVCSGRQITKKVLSGAVPGTVYNWTRDNTATVTGIAASGSGDISGTITNTTIAPITVTFTITPSYTNASVTCTGTPITATVTVNPNPVSAFVTGGGVFCQSVIDTLKGPIDPNYTYAWERSLTGIAAPNSFAAFGGTSQTQAVSASGVYRLNVTNQFGCITSDTASIAIADYVFNGSLAAGDAQQTGRMNRFATVSTCAAPKSYPGTFATSGARFFDTYTITNPRAVPVCATIGLTSSCGTNIFSAAYLGSFNPADITANYLADHGSSFPNTAFYEATIPANGTIVIVVHEVNPGTGCSGYQLTVDVPRDASPITSVAAGASYNLTAPVATSYLWSPGGGTTQTVSTAMLPGNKFFVTTGYGNAGCTKLDSITFATILNVNTSTYFVTIQNAIDAASNGDTIQIPANTYLENLVVNKNISFKFTSNNDVTISSITVDATKELKHNLSFNTTTFTNNGIYTSKGFVGKLINNGRVAPKQP